MKLLVKILKKKIFAFSRDFFGRNDPCLISWQIFCQVIIEKLERGSLFQRPENRLPGGAGWPARWPHQPLGRWPSDCGSQQGSRQSCTNPCCLYEVVNISRWKIHICKIYLCIPYNNERQKFRTDETILQKLSLLVGNRNKNAEWKAKILKILSTYSPNSKDLERPREMKFSTR